ncbi:uncharacterized protein LOC110267296 [Arachis ipaensis]|uniref:uncharacterized protein LOC110267296 n=1 Tax=Arachis ipaensis TaxID=130454 RepID=UPI000A2B74C8|nr:uncharacterized protein LOC110267296 [Arachis ipaensis]
MAMFKLWCRPILYSTSLQRLNAISQPKKRWCTLSGSVPHILDIHRSWSNPRFESLNYCPSAPEQATLSVFFLSSKPWYPGLPSLAVAMVAGIPEHDATPPCPAATAAFVVHLTATDLVTLLFFPNIALPSSCRPAATPSM